MLETLVDKIYEAAVVPELWPTVLDDLTLVGRGHFCALFTFGQGGPHIISSKDGVRISQDYVTEGWPERTDRLPRLLATRHAGFLGDLDVYTREEMDREPVFTEFHRPRGLGWGIATAIPVPSGDMLIVDIERRFETGPAERETIAKLDVLRPHLARSVLLSARLAFERAKAATLALDAIGLPGAVLSHDLRILTANSRMDALIPKVVQDRRQRIALVDSNADGLLARSLELIAKAGIFHPGLVGSIPIAAKDGEPPYIVHVVPLRRAAHDVFSNASVMLVVTPVVPAEVPNAEVLQGLFDLTPAEARVARAIGEGKTVELIASGLGLSRETIRSQLKAVLAKTGMTRQVELAALLSRLRPLP